MDKLQELKNKWRSYSTEFAESDYMDIEDHTSMALEVGGLISTVEEQQKEIEAMTGHYHNAARQKNKSDDDRIKLRKENARLKEFIKDINENWDCDIDAHRYNTICRACEAGKLLNALEETVEG